MSPKEHPVRLACVRHAASVRPEPGSNSQKVVSKPLRAQIKFLNNLLLAFITQEFSLAVIRSKTLKQSILIVQGVNLVRLCVIQFTRYIRSLKRTLTY